MIYSTQPLGFPVRERVYIPRHLDRLHGLQGWAEERLTTPKLVKALVDHGVCSVILSATGTGKTSFLRKIKRELDEKLHLYGILAIQEVLLGSASADDATNFFRNLTGVLAASVKREGFQIETRKGADTDFPIAVAEWPQQLTLQRGEQTRLLVLLDNIQDVPLPLAEKLAAKLSSLSDQSHGEVQFIISGNLPLRELTRGHWSFVRDICGVYTLVDFTAGEMAQAFETTAVQALGIRLDSGAREEIGQWTAGYPYYVQALFARLESNVAYHNRFIEAEEIREICDEILQERGHPIDSALDRIVRPVAGAAIRGAESRVLLDLLDGNLLTFDLHYPEVDFLYLQGFIKRGADRQIVWRSGLTEAACRARRHELPSGKRYAGELRASGSIYVALILDMDPFMASDEDRVWLSRLRGSPSYVRALRKLARQSELSGEALFEPDDLTERIRQKATAVGIFRPEVARSDLMPSFRLRCPHRLGGWLGKQLGRQLSDEERGMVTWDEVRVRLTKYGTVLVVLEISNEDPEKQNRGTWPLSQALEKVLGLEKPVNQTVSSWGPERQAKREGARSGQPPAEGVQITGEMIQWYMAVTVIGRFFEEVLNDRLETQDEAGDVTLAFRYPHYDTWKTALRDRYIIYLFRRMCADIPEQIAEKGTSETRVRDKAELTWMDIAQHKREVACLLEGVIVEEEPGIMKFPEYKLDQAEDALRREDLATWDGETCLISLDNAVICYHDPEQQLPECPYPPGAGKHCYCERQPKASKLWFPAQDMHYHDYWDGIVHALEHIVNLRMTAQLLANAATQYQTEAADLARPEVSHRRRSQKFEKRVEALRSDVADTSRLLSHVRDASLPTFLSKADYAVAKFAKLMEVSRLAESLQYTTHSMEELDRFFEHHDSRRAEEAERRMNLTGLWVSLVFSLLAIALSSIALPSFVADLFAITNTGNSNKDLVVGWLTTDLSLRLVWVGVAVIVVAILAGVFALVATLQRLGRRAIASRQEGDRS